MRAPPIFTLNQSISFHLKERERERERERKKKKKKKKKKSSKSLSTKGKLTFERRKTLQLQKFFFI
jgi:hypothetical protein